MNEALIHQLMSLPMANEAKAVAIMEALQKLGVSATGLATDSRALVAGDIFMAYPGLRTDGRKFIAQAVKKGASAVLWEEDGQGNNLPAGLTVPNVAVRDLQRVSGYLANCILGHPSDSLRLVGVTGTNGKTSVSQWIAQAYAVLGSQCAVIGTLGNGFLEGTEGSTTHSVNTTPDAVSVHSLLAQFRTQGAQTVAIEVSSIGLDQGRVNGVQFDVAVFTNLTRDHLDYHMTMSSYGSAKSKLFAMPHLHTAVVNLDDPFGYELMRSLVSTPVQRIGYTLSPESVPVEMRSSLVRLISAKDIEITSQGMRFVIVSQYGGMSVSVPLAVKVVGRFNISNLLAVLGSLIALDVPFQQAVYLLDKLVPPEGRMQMLGGGKMPLVTVDYAHTPDALQQALSALRPMAAGRGGRLICVFGCGGERDQGKRSLMGAVAAELADQVWITSDNPRGEQPHKIIQDILGGMGEAKIGEENAVRPVISRSEAIESAIEQAQINDVILIAGKGHEKYQEIAGKRFDFCDLAHAEQALAHWQGA